jgi:hypothetical protein
MAKAPASRKASRKPGVKSNKRPAQDRSAVKAAATKGPSRASATRAAGKNLPAGSGRKGTGSSPKPTERQAMAPETPPPLPAPIASFTF